MELTTQQENLLSGMDEKAIIEVAKGIGKADFIYDEAPNLKIGEMTPEKLKEMDAFFQENSFQGMPLQTAKEMNNFRINFYKKNPKATERACRRALMKKFNITIPNNVSTKK